MKPPFKYSEMMRSWSPTFKVKAVEDSSYNYFKLPKKEEKRIEQPA